MIQIDKAVPLPPPTKRYPKYPWAEMRAGDSFAVDNADWASVRVQASRRKETHGEIYTCRMVKGGVRVWRVA